jgi:hypothetical protein
MDRFNSHEEVDFDRDKFLQGRLSRFQNKPLSSNPYDVQKETFQYKAWNAGWADADMDPTILCPECGKQTEVDSNSFQCHPCQRLWPLSYMGCM